MLKPCLVRATVLASVILLGGEPLGGESLEGDPFLALDASSLWRLPGAGPTRQTYAYHQEDCAGGHRHKLRCCTGKRLHRLCPLQAATAASYQGCQGPPTCCHPHNMCSIWVPFVT